MVAASIQVWEGHAPLDYVKTPVGAGERRDCPVARLLTGEAGRRSALQRRGDGRRTFDPAKPGRPEAPTHEVA